MTTRYFAESDFLEEIKKQPMTVNDALRYNFGTQIDAIDIIQKFLSLGLLKFDNDSGNFFYFKHRTSRNRRK